MKDDDDHDDDHYDEKYEFKTNVNKSLSNILEIPEMKNDEQNTWIPPSEHGLRNSISIIPEYYNHHKTDYFNIDYFEIIKDDIRNMRELNEYQMEFINKLSHEEKNKLFHIFNECLHIFQEIIKLT